MAFSAALAERIRQRLARRKNVEEKKMFGGIGFLLNGNMLVGVSGRTPCACGSTLTSLRQRYWNRTSRSSTSRVGR